MRRKRQSRSYAGHFSAGIFFFSVLIILLFAVPQRISAEEGFSSVPSKILLRVPGIRWKKDSSGHFIYYYEKRSHFTSYSKKAEAYFEKISRENILREMHHLSCPENRGMELVSQQA